MADLSVTWGGLHARARVYIGFSLDAGRFRNGKVTAQRRKMVANFITITDIKLFAWRSKIGDRPLSHGDRFIDRLHLRVG